MSNLCLNGSPYAYPWNTLLGQPWPSMLPIAPLGGQVLLPIGTFSDDQVFWAGADFGRWLQALGLAVTPDDIAVSAYVINGADNSAADRWTGAAALVNGLAPPYGTGWPSAGVRRQFGPGIAGVTYGFVATCTLSDGTVLSQSSFGGCIPTGLEQTISISSGTYDAGAVSLTLASSSGVAVGGSFSVVSATGTGSTGSLVGQWVAGADTVDAVLNYTIATDLTMTISGGSVVT